MWGRSYYLQPDPHDKKKVHWQPLKNVPAYTWIRCLSGDPTVDKSKEGFWVGILGWPTGHGSVQVWGLSRNRNRVLWWSRATNPGTSLLVKPKVVKYWRNLCTCFPLNLECLWLTSNSSVETSLHWVQHLFSQFEMNNGCHLISSKNSRNFQPWNLAFFWSAQVIGAWRDDDGAVYTITMDASGDSASASIKRQDGRRFEAKETIKCGEQGCHGAVSLPQKKVGTLKVWKEGGLHNDA